MVCRKLISLLSVFQLFLLSACNASASDNSTAFPTGKFIHEKNKGIAFQFNEDGTLLYFFGNLDQPEVKGTYQIEGYLYTELTANDPTCAFPATYTWAYNEPKLSFQLFGEDECVPRKAAYDGQTFIKVP